MIYRLFERSSKPIFCLTEALYYIYLDAYSLLVLIAVYRYGYQPLEEPYELLLRHVDRLLI